MALADYRLCDVCGGKAFYDSDLSYEKGPSEWSDTPPFREAGVEQYDTPEKCQKWGMRLGYVGDWAVICTECSPKFKTLVVPIDFEPPAAKDKS